jgi:methyltransferase (TIGR00027 family)
MTARRVSAHRLSYARLPWAAGDAGAEDALAADVAGDTDVRHGRMHEYLRVRTAFFDRFVVGGLEAGTRQVVVGGAGYDGRSLRYAAPGARWFEVDHPATQQDKLARLRRLGVDTGGVRFVAADFTADPAGQLLLDAGLDAQAPALFLVEGVAVYLAPDVVENLLGQFRDVAGPGSRLAVSMPVTGTFRTGTRFRSAVAAMREPALSRFEPAEAEALLASTGWPLVQPGSDDDPARWERLRGAGLLVTEAGPRPAPDTAGRPGPRAVPAPARQPGGTPPRQAGTSPRERGTTSSRERVAAPSGESGPVPSALPVLLSQALVAFTIEADNEAEHLLPHRTADYGVSVQGPGPWLVSLAMYENCLRFLDQPRTVAELRRLARTGTNLDGMRRWGYATISGTAITDSGRRRRPGQDAVLRATPAGALAREVRAPLPALIEDRWRERYGAPEIGRLRDALTVLVRQLDPGLPDCLPILGQGMYSRLLGQSPGEPPDNGLARGRAEPGEPGDERDPLPLHALLSRPLLAFAVEFERDSDLSLAISANVLRVLSAEGVRLRDLPLVSGVSKEAIAMAMRVLATRRLAVTDQGTDGGRWKVARLTAKGIAAQRAYHEHLASCERRWQDRLDGAALGVTGDVLTALATPGEPDAGPPLFAALAPYPDGWRAQVRPPATLPHYPMVLHRGGYPDGS